MAKNFFKEEFFDYRRKDSSSPCGCFSYSYIAKVNMSEEEIARTDGYDLSYKSCRHKINFYNTLEEAISSSRIRADLISFILDSEEDMAEAKEIVDRLMRDKDYRARYKLPELEETT